MSSISVSTPLDLSYLYTISDDDRDFVKDMIETIIKNTPENVAEIVAARKNENWNEVGRLVHKLKPSLLLLNIEHLTSHIKSFETNAKEQINLDEADLQLQQLEEYCSIIVSELTTEVANDTY
ncbi:Hpt domain-containing protein [Reichenbachiella versicolor]|uniref:Hpt domain-containing protein n=1 Tax=Reichenbachiella versicolor TaxID=1821036 RepID=UPI000D6DC90E|nr:Hpt domain-containing protein [Reichenbachiella versicolor]